MIYSRRCSACTCEYPVIPGDGPVTYTGNPNGVLFVGERPGKTENAKGRPFIGQAGLEFNKHLLQLAGLDRDHIRITNTVKCWAVANRKPSPNEIAACTSTYLSQEIEEMDPKLIVLMGGVACGLVPDLDLETHHGTNQLVSLFGSDRMVFVTYHPAAGLHDPKKIRQLREDFERLGQYLSDDLVLPTDTYAGREKYGEDKSVLLDTKLHPPALDTETIKVPSKPVDVMWSAQLSNQAGTGVILWADKRADMEYLQLQLNKAPELMIHNAPFDMDVLWRAGLTADWDKVVDTMVRAYHRDMAQGLKPLAYRTCGMKMQEYQDLVMPYSRDMVMDWMGRFEEHVPKVVDKVLKKTGEIRYKNHPLQTRINGIARSMVTGSSGYDPWKAWGKYLAKQDDKTKQAIDLAYEIISKDNVGPMPMAGLDKVPRKKAVYYACRDADAGWRVEMNMRLEDNELLPKLVVDRMDVDK